VDTVKLKTVLFFKYQLMNNLQNKFSTLSRNNIFFDLTINFLTKPERRQRPQKSNAHVLVCSCARSYFVDIL